MWQADFSRFRTPGSYQIETDWQISPPFAIRARVYDRILAGYLTFLRAQRCGCAVFGVHDACHLDDGILDPMVPRCRQQAAGMTPATFASGSPSPFTISMLCSRCMRVGEDLGRGGIAPDSLLDEVSWGNTYFHRMIDPQWPGL